VFDLVLERTGWLRCVGHVPATVSWPSTAKHYPSTLWQSIN
jgi:hypothetical protein